MHLKKEAQAAAAPSKSYNENNAQAPTHVPVYAPVYAPTYSPPLPYVPTSMDLKIKNEAQAAPSQAHVEINGHVPTHAPAYAPTYSPAYSPALHYVPASKVLKIDDEEFDDNDECKHQSKCQNISNSRKATKRKAPEMNKSADYMGYQMKFLKSPKLFTLTDPVHIKKSKFNYHLKDISDKNYDQLNIALQEVESRPDQKLTDGREQYLRSDTNLKIMDKMSKQISTIPSVEYTTANVKICLQGRKEKNHIIYPIWKLVEIRCIV